MWNIKAYLPRKVPSGYCHKWGDGGPFSEMNFEVKKETRERNSKRTKKKISKEIK